MTSKIEQQVMAGVGLIYVMRQLFSRTALEIYALALSFLAIVFFVSISHVEANFIAVSAHGLPGVSGFILSAILQTKLIVQVALFIGAIGLVSFFVDMARSLSRIPTTLSA